jgi:hypothetical protein
MGVGRGGRAYYSACTTPTAYSVRAEAHGTGRNAYVVITKTHNWYERSIASKAVYRRELREVMALKRSEVDACCAPMSFVGRALCSSGVISKPDVGQFAGGRIELDCQSQGHVSWCRGQVQAVLSSFGEKENCWQAGDRAVANVAESRCRSVNVWYVLLLDRGGTQLC